MSTFATCVHTPCGQVLFYNEHGKFHSLYSPILTFKSMLLTPYTRNELENRWYIGGVRCSEREWETYVLWTRNIVM